MLILRYPRVDLFEPLLLFPDVYVDVSDFAMDPILSALDKVMDDERLLLLAWNDWITRRPNCLQTGRRSTPVEALLRLQAVRRTGRRSRRAMNSPGYRAASGEPDLGRFRRRCCVAPGLWY